MKAGFLTELSIEETEKEGTWKLLEPLRYYSAILDREIEVPKGFETDLSSVPRVPIVYWLWGDRAHREGVLHDWCFYTAIVNRHISNRIFLEAMKSRGKPFWIRWNMYLGVEIGSLPAWNMHRRLGHP